MNKCSRCNQNKPGLPPAVLEVINKEPPVLFHKVVFPASLGDDVANPPESLNYKNVLLNFEANNHSYLYSSDGVPTFISMGELDVDEIMGLLQEQGVEIKDLQTNVAELQTNLANETTAREEADSQLQSSINTTKEELDGLSNLVNEISDEISSSQGDITELQTQVTANSTDVSSLKTDMATAKEDIAANTTSIDQNTSAIDAINSNLNQNVEYSTAFSANDSTITVQHGKVNLNTNKKSTTSETLPVASTSNAGVMNAATFSAVESNTQTTQALLSGAVAIQDVPSTPTQQELTNLWKVATGIDTLINRSSIFDVTNNKVWTYYTNDSTWHPTGTTEGVAVSQATNTSLGIVKGSTQAGQSYAEADGTLSVNGWDSTQASISTLQSTLAEQGALLDATAAQLEDTQKDANDALGDIAAIQADYLKKDKVLSYYEANPDVVEVYNAHYVDANLNAVKTSLDFKQNKLISQGEGQNIKTVGGQNLLGTGDVSLTDHTVYDIQYVSSYTEDDLQGWLGRITAPELPSTPIAGMGIVVRIDNRSNLGYTASPLFLQLNDGAIIACAVNMYGSGITSWASQVTSTNAFKPPRWIVVQLLFNGYGWVAQGVHNPVLDLIYPIGSIYISYTLDTAAKVQEALGGIWDLFSQGRTLIGAGKGVEGFTTSGITGGEKEHTLTINEMPRHTHNLKLGEGSIQGTALTYSRSNSYYSYSEFIQNSGGDAPHNNLPPYITVYMWRRTG